MATSPAHSPANGHDIGICYGCNLERERHTAHNLGGCTADCGTLYLLWHGYGVVNQITASQGGVGMCTDVVNVVPGKNFSIRVNALSIPADNAMISHLQCSCRCP